MVPTIVSGTLVAAHTSTLASLPPTAEMSKPLTYLNRTKVQRRTCGGSLRKHRDAKGLSVSWDVEQYQRGALTVGDCSLPAVDLIRSGHRYASRRIGLRTAPRLRVDMCTESESYQSHME